ncbi:putative cell surface antigen Sca3 [Rickettsia endosymbiont of Ixodes pacificus]|nr:putative cell surface antigen Sca3 [Rickettsia endosymbiont of Ixodes pacificus]
MGGNVTVNNFNFTSDGIAAVGGTLTATAGVDYNNAAARLQFNGAVGTNPYTFASPVLQANNGILDVYTNLLATNASIGTLATINISNVVGPVNGEFTVTVPGNFALGGTVNIATAGSQLIIEALAGGQTVNSMKVMLIIPFTEYGLAHITAKRYKKPLTDLAVIKLNLPVVQSGSIPL